jgi:hypothetical protein
MDIDYGAWRFWWDFAQTLILAAIGIYTWLVNRTRVNSARIRELETDIDGRLDKHDERLTRVEEMIKHGPTHTDLKRIHQRMDEAATAISSLAGEFKGVKGTLDLIHQYLLNEGKRR